jgi:MFS family permease
LAHSFIFSSVMVAIGLWVRFKLVESDAFKKAQKQGAIVKVPFVDTMKHHFKAVVLGTFAMLATYVLFYLMTTFSLSYGTKPTTATPAGLGITYTDFVIMQIIGVVFFGVFTLLSGPMADSMGRRKLLLIITSIIIVFALAFPLFLDHKSGTPVNTVLVEVFLIIGFSLMGVTFGPMGRCFPKCSPPMCATPVRQSPTMSVRYSGPLWRLSSPRHSGALRAAAPGSWACTWRWHRY